MKNRKNIQLLMESIIRNINTIWHYNHEVAPNTLAWPQVATRFKIDFLEEKKMLFI